MISKRYIYIYLSVAILFLGVFLQNATAGPCDSYRETYDDAAQALEDAQTVQAIAYAAWQQATMRRYYNDYVDPSGQNKGKPSDDRIEGLSLALAAASYWVHVKQQRYDEASEDYSRCLTLNRHVCGCPSTNQNVSSCSCSWQSYRYGVNCPCYDS